MCAIQEQFSIDRKGTSHPESVSGPDVNFVGDGIKLWLGVPGQVGPFGQILADQAVHVFIGSALPRVVRVAKVHGNAGLRGQCFVQDHLPALVVGHPQPHRLGNAVELVGECAVLHFTFLIRTAFA